jgi:putative endonuclease
MLDVGESATNAQARNSALAWQSPPKSAASKRHYVYMLECSDNSLYAGYTTNPTRRIAEHNRGTASRYTRTRRPVRLVFLQELASRREALAREIRIKRMNRNEKLLLCRGEKQERSEAHASEP